MASEIGRRLWRRQQSGLGNIEDDYDDDYQGDGSFWWTPAGMAVRYAIVAALFGAILLFLVGGYYSTQRRLRRNQPPRPIFRWMARRRQPYYYNDPSPNRPYYQQQQQYAAAPHHADPNSQGYGMHGYPAPPPPYTNGEGDGPPPVYQPPMGASKALPDQNFRVERVAGEGSSNGGGVEAPPPVARR